MGLPRCKPDTSYGLKSAHSRPTLNSANGLTIDLLELLLAVENEVTVPTGAVATKAVAVETSEVLVVRGSELVAGVRTVAASECRVDAVTRTVRLTQLRQATEHKRRNWLWSR